MGRNIIGLFYCFISIFGTAQDDTISTIPSEFIHSINDVSEGFFLDSAHSFLKSKILNSNFIVFGETHGIHESTELLQQIVKLKKIDYFITEIDSFSLNFIEKYLNQSDFLLGMIPGVFAMYSCQEELALLTFLKEHQTELVGIDMVHPCSIRLELRSLLQCKSLTFSTLKKIDHLIHLHSKSLKLGFLKTKVLNKSIKLLNEIKVQDNECDTFSINFILKSLELKYSMGNRSKSMIDRLDYLNDNTPLKENNVLFKFGSSHTLKTINTAGFRDLGWYIDSLALLQDQETLFLTVIPVSGQSKLPLKINGQSTKEIEALENRFTHENVLYNSINHNDVSFYVDVKSFRKKMINNHLLAPYLKYILENYDGILYLHKATPSKTY